MSQRASEALRWGARGLARLEIVALAVIYFYFIVTDSVPLVAFGLIGLMWLVRWVATGRVTRSTRFDLPILLLIAWVLVSYSVSISPWQSQPKVYGVLLSALFFYAIVNHITTRRDLAWAIFWLALVCLAIALAGLVGTDWAQGKIVSASFLYDRLPRFIQGIPRSIAGGFARNGVGGTLTLTIPLLAALVASQSSENDSLMADRAPLFTIVVWVALASSLVTLALTQSRGGILGTLVGLFGVAVWRERRVAWLAIVGALGLLGALGLGYGNALLDFVLRMDAQSGTLASRLEVWQRGVMMVQDFAYTGIGIGTYNQMAHLFYPFFIAAPDEVVPHAHNHLLEVAVDVGIPGLIAYVALLTGFFVGAARAYRTADGGGRARMVGLACGMLAHQTFGLTDAFILGTKPGVLMWVYLALVAREMGSEKE